MPSTVLAVPTDAVANDALPPDSVTSSEPTLPLSERPEIVAAVVPSYALS